MAYGRANDRFKRQTTTGAGIDAGFEGDASTAVKELAGTYSNLPWATEKTEAAA